MYYCCTTIVLLLYYYCTTTVLLLYYYCITTVLLLYCTVLLLYYYGTTVLHCATAQYHASEFVDCGGECRLEGKVFKMKVVVVILERSCPNLVDFW